MELSTKNTWIKHLERCKEWELDMRFGKWNVQSGQGSGERIIIKCISKGYHGEASIFSRQGRVVGSLKCFDKISGAIQCGEFIKYVGN
jgi:hypothetical protein